MPSAPVIWTEADDQRLRDGYPHTGSATFVRGKTKNAVKQRAAFLGLRKSSRPPTKVGDWFGSREVIEIGIVSANGEQLARMRCRCKSEALVKLSALRAGYQHQCLECSTRQAHRAGFGAIVSNPKREQDARRTG